MNPADIQRKINSASVPAFAYDRVSTSSQAEEGISLAYQETQAEQYAQRAGIEIVHFFTVAESARSSERRKMFREMIEAARNFGVRHLIFKNVDRMSRNYADLVLIEQLIDEEGFHVHFYQNNKMLNADSNHNDRFILGIEIAVAKQLSDKLSHDMREVHRHKVRHGIMPGRSLGYTYDRDTKRHMIDPETEEMLRYLFDTFDNEKISVAEMTDRMNQRGYCTSTGRPWHKSITHRLLSSPVYCGMFEYRGEIFEGVHQAFYPAERYYSRRCRLDMKYTGTRKRNYEFLLAGLLQCQGKTLTGEVKKNKYIYYTNRFNGASFRQEDIFRWIDADIESIQFSPNFAEYIKELFRESVQEQEQGNRHVIGAVNRQISKIRVRIDRLLDLYVDGDVDRESLTRKVDLYRREISRLQENRKRAELDKAKFILKSADIVDQIQKFPALWQNSTPEEKAELLPIMATHVTIENERASVAWRKPFSIILIPELIDHAQKVRKFHNNLHEWDDFRTLIPECEDLVFSRISPELQFFVAA